MRACVRLIITMCLVTTYAPAWGIKGHRLIAELAEKRLIARNPRVLKRIAGLLGPGVSLSSIAVCADSIRDYVRDRDKPGVVLPDNCLVTKQQAIEQFPITGSWHFINIPLSSDSHFSAHPDSILEQACAANAPCVTTQINFFASLLKNKNASKHSRAIALMFLVHLVGDIHQPAHAVDRDKDRGGNLVWVKLGSGVMRLHSLWDSGLLEGIAQTSVSGSVDTSHKTPKSWAWESYDCALSTVYKDVPVQFTSENNPIVLPNPGYRPEAEAVIRNRLYAAGIRLADLLARALL